MSGKAMQPALPRRWPRRVKTAILAVMSMLRAAFNGRRRVLDHNAPAEFLDPGGAAGAVLARAGEHHAYHTAAVRVGGRFEEHVNRRPAS